MADRAKWQHTFEFDATVKGFSVPGALGRDDDGTTDDRKIRCFYAVNSGVRTEVIPGDMSLSVAVSADDYIDFDCDFVSSGIAVVDDPWIGSADDLSGPSMVYDDGFPDAFPATVSGVQAIDSVTIRATFVNPVVDNPALRNPGNYTLTGDTDLAVASIQPEDVTNPTYVDIVVNEMRQGGDYSLIIDSIKEA